MWTKCSSISLTVGSDVQAKRSEILNLFTKQWKVYEDLFLRITDKGLTTRADPLRHPLIFYFGHTAVFYINKLTVGGIIPADKRINGEIESLFAIGVDEMSWDDLLPDTHNWPTRAVIQDYRNKVKEIVTQVINETPLEKDTVISWSHPLWIILMGIEHELIHLETSSVLIRQLPLDQIIQDVSCLPKDDFPPLCPEMNSDLSRVTNEITFISQEAGEIHLGRNVPCPENFMKNPNDIYGWDNEYGSHKANVEKFCLAEKLISNGEFLQFVLEKGYENQKYWTTEEGWKWVSFKKPKFPKFWIYKGNESDEVFDANLFVQRNLYSVSLSMPWDWPVEVNCLEAGAYCRWLSEKKNLSNLRLMTEDEYSLAVSRVVSTLTETLDANNSLVHYSSSSPVNKFKQGDFYDLIGNVWQWTRTPIYPFNNFKAHPIYDDFTVPTFDDMHNLMKGGSWISLGNEAARNSRYAFRRHFFQHAGFRVCYSPSSSSSSSSSTQEPSTVSFVTTDYDSANRLERVDGESQSGNIYETDSLVAMYNEFHFGPQAMFPVEKFPVVCARIVELVLKTSPLWNVEGRNLRVMDLGCATGRTSFEISRFANYTLGIDFSTRFIQVAYSLMKQGRLSWNVPVEGDLTQYRETRLFFSQNEVDDNNGCEIENPIKLFGKEEDGWNLLSSVFGSDVTDNLINNEKFQNLEHVSKDNMRFLQGDACNLKAIDGMNQFEAIIAANLIDRLYCPSIFLESVGSRIVQGGFLVLISPFTWLRDYTEVDKWIGGKKVNGENRTTIEGLKIALAKDFDFVPTHELRKDIRSNLGLDEKAPNANSNGYFIHPDDLKENIETFRVPMIIRETVNKHQCTFCVVSIWRKK